MCLHHLCHLSACVFISLQSVRADACVGMKLELALTVRRKNNDYDSEQYVISAIALQSLAYVY